MNRRNYHRHIGVLGAGNIGGRLIGLAICVGIRLGCDIWLGAGRWSRRGVCHGLLDHLGRAGAIIIDQKVTKYAKYNKIKQQQIC